MSGQSHTIVDMAEVWDELTPRKQLFMIQRAKGLAGYNKMKDKGIQFKPLHGTAHETTTAEQTETEK